MNDKSTDILLENEKFYSAEEYSYIFNNVPVGIYRSTPDGKLIFANKYFRDLLGINKNKIDLNQLSKELSYNREEFYSLIKSRGRVEDYLGEFKRDDGKQIAYLETAKAHFDELGTIDYFEGIVTDITNFKLVQDALHESEEKYRLLFEKSEEPILLIDGDKWVDCNEAALKVFRYKNKSELIGKMPYQDSPDFQSDGISSKEKAIQMINLAFQKGFHRFDWVHKTSDGRNIYVDVSLTAIPYKKKILLFTMFRDISKKMEAEKRLRYSEEKFRLIFENINEGILIIDSEGIIIDSNSAITQISGYEPDEIIGLPIWELLKKISVVQDNELIDLDSFNLYFERIKNFPNEKNLVKEKIIRRKDSSVACIHSNSILIGSNYGDMLCKIVKDMTEFNRINEKVLSQKELFEKLLKTSPIAIMLIDFDGNILFASHRIYEFFEPSDRQFAEVTNIKELTIKRNHKLIDKAIERVIEQGSLNNFEIDVYPFAGKVFRADVNASLIRNQLGEPEAIITTILNISERKQAEAYKEKAMAATLEALEKKHEAMELINNSARLASIGVIAGGIVHEISQPLNAIRIGSEGIITWDEANGKVLPTAIINMLSGITKASIRIEDIIKHMRNLWIGSNSESIELVDLNECIRAALNLVRMRAQSHEIQFEISLSEELILIDANKVHIELIINNLITNSVFSLDQSNKQEKIIKITSTKQNNKAFLIVYDNGIGLPAVSESKLFDPFYSTRQSSGGTGLGLAIVKMFVDKYKGSIHPLNNSDGGATFIIDFNVSNLGNDIYV